MCNYAPGECIAIADNSDGEVYGRLNDWHLPGTWELIPLIPEGPDGSVVPESSPLRRYVFVHMTAIPEGLEVLAASKLSAALHDLIAQHRAVVELNNFISLAAHQIERRRDQLSPQAARLIAKIRQYFSGQVTAYEYPPIAFLDSGVNTSSFKVSRPLTCRDYTGSRSNFGKLLDDDHGGGDHGTDIFRILDATLPENVPIVSGRIVSASSAAVTVLKVATAFAHLVATHNPAVVNLSLSPRDDLLICSLCRRPIPVDAFHSLILPFVFRIAASTTVTVMAAGNRGHISNARHALAEATSLVLVEAADSSGELAGYSNRVDSAYANIARIFGGDDSNRPGPVTVFENAPDSCGTSYAAPFISAAAYAYSRSLGSAANFTDSPNNMDFGKFCSSSLDLPIYFRPSTLDAAERIEVLA